MGGFNLLLRVVLLLLELFHRLLEFLVGLFQVSLGRLFLLFEELELAFPKGFVFVVLIVDISVHSLNLIILSPPFLNLFLDDCFVSMESHLELFIGLSQLQDFTLVILYQIFLLGLEVLILF
jgi:hypothetical protein